MNRPIEWNQVLWLSVIFIACLAVIQAFTGSPGVEPITTAALNIPPPAGVDRYLIDDTQSSATYTVHEFFFQDANEVLGRKRLSGDAITTGRTEAVSGQLDLDLSADVPVLRGGQIVVDISTLRSNRPERDAMIRRNWLESSRFPLAIFEVATVSGYPDTYEAGTEVELQITGALTIRESTQPVTMDVTAILAEGQLVADGSTQLRMTDFGFDPPQMANVVAVDDEFEMAFQLTAQAIHSEG